MKTKPVILSLAFIPCALAMADAVPGWSLPGDTPEKIADPAAMTQQVERLRVLKPWTGYATPEEIALFDGPEVDIPEIPASEYNLEGFDAAILGSKVPAPGVHPRVLFNFEDLPAMRERLMATEEGRKRFEKTGKALEATMLNPATEDGQVFAKLEGGDIEGLKFMDPYEGANGNHRFEGYPNFGLHPSHVCYWPRNLHSLGFYALMKGDEELSRRTANAVFNYYKLREPLIDAHNARADDPNAENAWPGDVWRGMHYVAGEGHLGMAYDMTARYMTDEQKALMRRVIAKATGGKRSYGVNGPIRWRDTNWVGWDTQHFLTHLAIEGEEGYDPEIYQSGRDTICGFLTHGINSNGNIFETNGKNIHGLRFALTSALALARRGDNMFGHPHLRKLSEAQVQQTVPDKTMNVNNGTYGCANFGGAGFLKNLFPKDKSANWLLRMTHNWGLPLKGNDLKFPRIRPLTTDEFFDFAPYETPEGVKEGDIVSRAHLGLPLDMADGIHGQLNTRSSQEPNAAFMMFEARPDLYFNGHQQHDAGHFYFSALGKNWAIESDHGLRDSRVHNVVLIDGIGQGESQHLAPSKVDWLGSAVTKDAAFASADLSRGYAFLWSSPMHYSWTHPDKETIAEWRPESDPEVVKAFKGTQHWKCRIWDESYWHRPWGPTMRGTYNPVKHAYRTAGLVRGEHPYGVVVDSIRKDDKDRTYAWQMHVPSGTQLVTLDNGMKALRQGEGGPLLVVKSLGPEAAKDNFLIEDGEIPSGRKPVVFKRLSIQRTAGAGDFTVLLIPLQSDQAPPEIREEAGIARVSFPGAKTADEIAVKRAENGKPAVAIDRITGAHREKVVEL